MDGRVRSGEAVSDGEPLPELPEPMSPGKLFQRSAFEVRTEAKRERDKGQKRSARVGGEGEEPSLHVTLCLSFGGID